MIPRRVLCPTSASWHDRYFVTDQHWTIATADGVETVLCSAACALPWLVYSMPADLVAAVAITNERPALEHRPETIRGPTMEITLGEDGGLVDAVMYTDRLAVLDHVAAEAGNLLVEAGAVAETTAAYCMGPDVEPRVGGARWAAKASRTW